MYHLFLNLGSIQLDDLWAFLKIFMGHKSEPINIFSNNQYVVQSVHVLSFSDIKESTNLSLGLSRISQIKKSTHGICPIFCLILAYLVFFSDVMS